jgi:nucleotidyltransferase/DNA polymerase involved in DNA repair
VTTETTLLSDDKSSTDDLSILQETTDPDKDYFAELVGDDKRYKTPQEIARSKAEGDLYIKRLERELAGLRSELSSKSSVETLLTEMKTLKETANVSSDDISKLGENRNSTENQSATNITPEDIAKIVSNELQSERQRSQENENFNLVKAELAKRFGSNVEIALEKIKTDYNMSSDQVNALARDNPRALLALAPEKGGSNDSAGETAASLFAQGSRVDSEKISPNTNSGVAGRRDWAYYEKMRQTDPETYWSRDVQDMLHKDAINLGADFG